MGHRKSRTMVGKMNFYTRRWIRPNDLNATNRLFGGKLLSWIDEEAAIYAACQLKHPTVVTKFISEIDFQSPAEAGDVIEFGLEVVDYGQTSITLRCHVRKKDCHKTVITIDRLVFVAVNDKGTPTAHSYFPDSQLVLNSVTGN